MNNKELAALLVMSKEAFEELNRHTIAIREEL